MDETQKWKKLWGGEEMELATAEAEEAETVGVIETRDGIEKRFELTPELLRVLGRIPEGVRFRVVYLGFRCAKNGRVYKAFEVYREQ